MARQYHQKTIWHELLKWGLTLVGFLLLLGVATSGWHNLFGVIAMVIFGFVVSIAFIYTYCLRHRYVR